MLHVAIWGALIVKRHFEKRQLLFVKEAGQASYLSSSSGQEKLAVSSLFASRPGVLELLLVVMAGKTVGKLTNRDTLYRGTVHWQNPAPAGMAKPYVLIAIGLDL